MINQQVSRGVIGLFILCILSLIWFYSKGYQNSIGWEVTTTAETSQYPAIQVSGELMDFEIVGEKYLLTEAYSGGPITRNTVLETTLMSIAWLGLGLVIVSASFLKRVGFVLVLALFVLFINRLNLVEIGLFGSRNPFIVGGIPFLALIGPLYLFHELRPKTPFLVRFAIFLVSSLAILFFGIQNHDILVDHFISHSTFTFALVGVLFLIVVAEEAIFGILFLITQGKGGKSNHLHFIVLSLIYLLNLILHYLNKSGYFPNSFSFFDPYILLILSSLLAIWSLRYKKSYLNSYLPYYLFTIITFGLGIAFISFLNLNFLQGVDAVFESFHYLILYFHIGFGVFFFIYVIVNFIDPLIQGLSVYKIAYREQNFPYISSRLGGLVVVLGLYFLSNQEAYKLLRSGYYVHLANKEETLGNLNIASEYYQQAAYLGYNTHYPNYQIAWLYSDKGNDYLTKVHFEKAATRHPSPFAYVNYSLLSQELNSVKAGAFLDQAATKFSNGEIANNQGLMRMNRNEWDKALSYFRDAEATNAWNRAPMLNKWAAYQKAEAYDTAEMVDDYLKGNLGVKANILAKSPHPSFHFEDQLAGEPILHQQAYLLNAASIFSADTLPGLIQETINNSINANINDQLRKTLAIHYYKKGEINQAFRALDFLQANSYENGSYLNDLGILAFDQKAYQLAIDFFDRATTANYEAAKINRLEALAWLGRSDQIPDELIKIVQQDPGLTSFSNQLLSNLASAKFETESLDVIPNLQSLESDTLIEICSKNAFDEELVYEIISILNEREVDEAYDLILEATEINTYSVKLLISYVFTALKQNFTNYAESSIPKIKELADPQVFDSFLKEYEARLNELSDSEW